ncbi:MAG: hypothetical protein KGI33_10395 [Thaumarchaeota archaeon]|nr:hypothetical protein [Nitrososphaerota archaeon]
MDSKKERVSFRTQIVLAIIPSFISQLIAFYRVKKLVNGLVIEVAVFFIDMVIQIMISWPVGMIVSLPITIGIPAYYVRKWTLEFNARPQGFF